MSTLQNDGKTFISYAAACERYGLTPKALRALVRRHGLTRYRPITADRRHYLHLIALDAIPDLADPGTATTGLENSNRIVPRIRPTDAFGIPYARVDEETGDEVCPICGMRCGVARDRTGEAVESTYAEHYAQRHTRRLADCRLKEDWRA